MVFELHNLVFGDSPMLQLPVIYAALGRLLFADLGIMNRHIPIGKESVPLLAF